MKALLLLFALMMANPAHAATSPDEILGDPALEERARSLGKELRCLVCQNQSIDDSDAPLARDLRVIVRERLVEGDSDQQIRDYLVARYGDFVLLKPPFNLGTLALWGGPFVILLMGGVVIVRFVRNRPRTLETPTIDNHDSGRANTILGQGNRS